jgi:FlgD Ig-like domain
VRKTTTALVFVLVLAAGSAMAFTFWNETRTSALLPDQTVVLRTENPSGAGIFNSVLYDDGGIQELLLSPVPDGPATVAGLPLGPVSGTRGYGFRLVQPGEIDVLAVRVANGSSPAKADHSLLTTDPVGDDNLGLTFLDLTEIRLTRDDTRLYASFTNNGGGFPVSQGLTFYSYLLGITNPEDSSPETVFGMIQTVSVAGIIEPGLYQINGTGVNDLDKIGEITATEYPADNTLVLSCLLADLEANEIFQSWYDLADPRLDVAGFTQRITLLGGTVEADRTDGGIWHLREERISGGPNQLPLLTNLVLPDPGSGTFVSVTYDDPDGHCPVYAELVLDGSQVFPLRPQGLDYSGPVQYRSNVGIPALDDGTWTTALVRFSDNQTDEVSLSGAVSAVENQWSGTIVSASPNPFSGPTQLSFSLEKDQQVRLSIYDLAGRRIRTLVNSELSMGNHFLGWDGRDGIGRPQPAGIYFVMLKTRDEKRVSRVTLVR